MTFDRGLHIAQALALLIAGISVIYEMRTASALLSENFKALDEKVETHTLARDHHGARADITALTISVTKLHAVTDTQQKEIDRLRDGG